LKAPASLRSAWDQQAVWSATASRLKRRIERARSWILGLVIAGAVLETLAGQLAGAGGTSLAASRMAAAAGAIAIALAGALQARSRSAQNVTRWTRARSASEALKEQVFRYLTCTGAYQAPEPEAALREAVNDIIDKVRDLEALAATVQVPSREPPVALDLDSYVNARVEEQIDGYYRPRAKELAARRDTWRRAQTTLLFIGAALSALVAFLPNAGLANWVAVLTTVAGAFAAHIEAARYDYLVVGYRSTARRLEALRDEWRDALSRRSLSPDERTDFVNRCEEAISVENQAWMAEWARDG
jgi:hypothetical protein